MNVSYSSRALQSTVTAVLNGLRDLTSPDLATYQAAEPGSERRLAERYDVVSKFRTTSKLPLVTASQFAQDQAPSAGTAFFARAQVSQGIEETFTEDLVTSDVYSTAPDHLAAFIQVESRKIERDTASLDTKLGFAPQPSSLHLQEGTAFSVADDDALTYRRLQRSFDYTRSLIK